MKRLLFSIFSVFILLIAVAQTPQSLNPGLTNLAPPSPNASALLRFGAIPVSPSTGIPQINIPVYKYSNESTGLSLSVSLDYHAGGIHVDEVASNVGLGWALNVAGVVSRTVRGIADESVYGFLNTPYFDAQSGGNNPMKTPSLKPFTKAYSRELDIEADIFSYSFNGRYGRFTYGRDGSLLMLDDEKLKIQNEISDDGHGTTKFSKFTITDENGVQYTFAAAEQTQLQGVNGYFNSSWYLTKILSAVGKDSIVLEYADVTILPYLTSSSETRITGRPGGDGGNVDNTSGQSMGIAAKKITSIFLPNGINLLFTYKNTIRTDLPRDTLLDKITIQDPARQTARGFLLEQDYSLNNRATLLRVTPFAGINAEIKDNPYQFFYSPGLPDRLSNQQDHWGYPTAHPENGGSNAGNRIPHEVFSTGIFGMYELPGINKDADLNCMAATLNKIIYPTGGYTQFELEPNQAYDGWLAQHFAITVNLPPYKDTSTSFSINYNGGSPAYQDYYFTYNGEVEYTEFLLSMSPTGGSTTSGSLRVEIYPTTGNTQTTITSFDISYPFTSQSTHTFTLGTYLVKGAQYRLRFYFNSLGVSNLYTYASLSWKQKQVGQQTTYYDHTQPYVGGLRAKRIRDYDGISTDPVSVREFEYLTENGKSSGTLLTYPQYTTTVDYLGVSGVAVGNGAYGPQYSQSDGPDVILRQSSSIPNIAYTNGSPVTYSRVLEYSKDKNGNNNGKIERFFSTAVPGTGNAGNFYPYAPVEVLSWVYGLLQSESVYDASGNLIKKTVNSYNTNVFPGYGNADSVKNFTSYAIAPIQFQTSIGSETYPPPIYYTPRSAEVANYPPVYFLYNNYLPHAGRSDLVATSVYSYDINHNAIVSTKTFAYDPQYHYLKSTTTTDSKNQTITENRNYPIDMINAAKDPNGVYQAMKGKNILYPVIESTGIVANAQNKFLRTNYYSPASGMYKPGSIEVQSLTYPIESRINFNQYDLHGNLLEQQKTNDVHEVYLWGYNSQYPVVKIIGSDFNTVSTKVDTSVLNNGTDAQRSQQFANLRNAFASSPLIQVWTYTYAPLVGMISETDPKGNTVYYEYDGFGRLVDAKDKDGNVIKKYNYHYQGQ